MIVYFLEEKLWVQKRDPDTCPDRGTPEQCPEGEIQVLY